MISKIASLTPWIVLGIGLIILIIRFIFKNQSQNKPVSQKPSPQAPTSPVLIVPPPTNTQPTQSTSTNKKMGVFGWIWSILVTILIIVVIIWIISSIFNSCNRPKNPETASPTTQILKNVKYDGYTPFSESINYKFEIDSLGDPMFLKFPGISETIYYSGKGTFKVPPRKSGIVYITSADPNKEARLRIREVD